MLAFLRRDAHFPTIGDSDATRKQSHDEKSLERSAYRPYPEDRHRADDFSASRDRVQSVGDTFWSLFLSAIWFMTIVSHPDAQITDR
jgi:hypothetical protein